MFVFFTFAYKFNTYQTLVQHLFIGKLFLKTKLKKEKKK